MRPHCDIVEGHPVGGNRIVTTLLKGDQRIGGVRQAQQVQVVGTFGVRIGAERPGQRHDLIPACPVVHAYQNVIPGHVIVVPLTVGETESHISLTGQIDVKNQSVERGH